MINKNLIHTVKLYQYITNNIIDWLLYYNYSGIKDYNIEDNYKFNNKGYLVLNLNVYENINTNKFHPLTVGVNKKDFIYDNEKDILFKLIKENDIRFLYDYENEYALDLL